MKKSGFKLLRREYKLIGLGGIKFEKILAFQAKRGEQKPTNEYQWSGKIRTRKVKGVLKEMLDEKLKSAWSEEDERIYQSIIDDTVQENQLNSKQIGFLKSLKDRVQPQPHWKPSDLQIEALESATANCAYSEYEDCLQDLIKQLKKLREK